MQVHSINRDSRFLHSYCCEELWAGKLGGIQPSLPPLMFEKTWIIPRKPQISKSPCYLAICSTTCTWRLRNCTILRTMTARLIHRQPTISKHKTVVRKWKLWVNTFLLVCAVHHWPEGDWSSKQWYASCKHNPISQVMIKWSMPKSSMASKELAGRVTELLLSFCTDPACQGDQHLKWKQMREPWKMIAAKLPMLLDIPF